MRQRSFADSVFGGSATPVSRAMPLLSKWGWKGRLRRVFARGRSSSRGSLSKPYFAFDSAVCGSTVSVRMAARGRANATGSDPNPLGARGGTATTSVSRSSTRGNASGAGTGSDPNGGPSVNSGLKNGSSMGLEFFTPGSGLN